MNKKTLMYVFIYNLRNCSESLTAYSSCSDPSIVVGYSWEILPEAGFVEKITTAMSSLTAMVWSEPGGVAAKFKASD